jgi:hypothetical protein
VSEIGDGATAERHRYTASTTRDEAGDNELGDVIAQGVPDDEAHKNKVRGVVDWQAAIDLAERGYTHGPNGNTEDVKGDSKGADCLGGYVEVGDDVM